MLNLSNLRISSKILEKLTEKHRVTENEIYECFANREKGFLEDTRINHATHPPTLWFIAETDNRRLLKVVFIELPSKHYEIKTVYEPNLTEVTIYGKYA